MSDGVFIPYALADTLGTRDLAAVWVAATIETLYRRDPFLAGDGAWVRLSVRELAEAAHLTVHQVRRATEMLAQVGVLERRHHQVQGADRGRVPFSYRLVPQVSAVAA